MTTITLSAIELNARSGGVAICNGAKVDTTGLPTLSGSPKQVAWADQIRDAQIKALAIEIATRHKLVGPGTNALFNDGAMDAKVEAINAVLDRVTPALAGKTEAGWWIDRRSAGAVALMMDLVE